MRRPVYPEFIEGERSENYGYDKKSFYDKLPPEESWVNLH